MVVVASRFLTITKELILDQGLHHYMGATSHLALGELVAVGHFCQLTQRGVLPINQLVQLLGL